ncbi:iron-containing redox enzyme family protein [Subtercola frigoramans]|uniref:Iron-containing redox enzyme family protein n=1 Tax=Subtercola frigoramans TaxID=120298 RepID=A0ABS2L1I7_9MICO|nr:iron-containing redox enzyme family protein [Subtercola frigoramans]MBM7470630.1 hypothetical protein [Subtercola frigoramans]
MYSSNVVDRPTFASPHFTDRGPASRALLNALTGQADDADDVLAQFHAALVSALALTGDVLRDDDVQLTLFILYGLFYGSVVNCDEHWEWNTSLIAGRTSIESRFEDRLRAVVPHPELPSSDAESVARALFELTSHETGPSLARFVAKKATVEQLREFLVQRSIYTLKEADPHSWAIPRLTGRPKAALVEIQADEYGGGRPERMHSAIFARTMRGLGLDARYASYLDNVPAIILSSMNMMSMFGLNRRLRGAIVGHLAAFEMTSSIPSRQYGNGFRRLGYGPDVTEYFDEHVEADAVHEQIAGRDLAGALAEDQPALLADIMFGASACLTVDGWASEHILNAWTSQRSSLRLPLPDSVETRTR